MDTDNAIQSYFRFQGRMGCLPWYPRQGTRDDLARLFGKLGFNLGAEIGTHRGHFAIVLCNANPKLHLFCIDPWESYIRGPGEATQEKMEMHYKIAIKNLRGFNVELIRKKSMDAVSSFENDYLDFVYIDGNHRFDYVMSDIIYWVPKVRVGGIVACHDYHSEGGTEVRIAVNAYTHCHDIRPWYVTREQQPTAYWVRK